MLSYTPVEFSLLESLAVTFSIPTGLNQFIREKFFKNAPVNRIAVTMSTNSAFTGSYPANPIWYQQFVLTQFRKLRGCQLIVNFDAADNCPSFVTTKKAIIFQDGFPSIPVDNFKDHYVLVFDLTSMQDAKANFSYQN